MANTKELKEALKFVIELGNGLGKSLEDDKFSFTDAINFLPAAKALPAAFSGIKEIPDEIYDLDERERLDLVEFVKAELDLVQDEAELIAEKAFSVLSEIFGLVKLFLPNKEE